MAYFSRTKMILANVQDVAGTPETLAAATHAIQTLGDVTIGPIAAAQIDRQRSSATFGADAAMLSEKHRTYQFGVEWIGSGAAGAAPGWGVLARACGLAETIVTDTSVAYAPASTGHEIATLWGYHGGSVWKAGDAMGEMALEFGRGAIPRLGFNFMGDYTASAAAALPADADYSAFLKALPPSKANTPTATLHGFAGCLERLTFNLGNRVVYTDRPNCRGTSIRDRRTVGSIVIETPTPASKDYFAIVDGETTGALALTHGTVGGRIVSLTAPAVQLLNPVYVDLDGLSGVQMDLRFLPVDGDDEFVMTLT